MWQNEKNSGTLNLGGGVLFEFDELGHFLG
jgi:hypothetical protein